LALALYLNAFFDLDTNAIADVIRRSRVPPCFQYARDYDLTIGKRDDLWFYVQRMDNAALNWQMAKKRQGTAAGRSKLMGDLATLAKRMRTIATNLPTNTAKLAAEVANEVVESLEAPPPEGTPVDTSQALSNWQVGLGAPVDARIAPHFVGEKGSTQGREFGGGARDRAIDLVAEEARRIDLHFERLALHSPLELRRLFAAIGSLFRTRCFKGARVPCNGEVVAVQGLGGGGKNVRR
jgi:hypothetical protein